MEQEPAPRSLTIYETTFDRTDNPPKPLASFTRQQDGSAWNEFVRVYGPIIFGYCRLKQLQESDAADVSLFLGFDVQQNRAGDILARVTSILAAMPTFEQS